jgi:hypothetical protein
MTDQTPFRDLNPQITDNERLREPQREGYEAISEHFADEDAHRSRSRPAGCW